MSFSSLRLISSCKPIISFMADFSGFTVAAPPVEAEGLAVAPPDCREAVLLDVNLTIPERCRAALVGANGSGKSTLLRSFAGLLPPLAGKVRIFGNVPDGKIPELCYLAQRSRIDWSFPVSVREMVVFGRRIRKRFFAGNTRRDWEKADEALEKLKLSDLARRNIGELSGGQQQRVLLARALCQDAQLLFLDEPYVGLDTRSRDIMDEMLFGKAGESLTLIMATHDLSDALGHFDCILEIRDGRLRTVRECSGHERFVEIF